MPASGLSLLVAAACDVSERSEASSSSSAAKSNSQKSGGGSCTTSAEANHSDNNSSSTTSSIVPVPRVSSSEPSNEYPQRVASSLIQPSVLTSNPMMFPSSVVSLPSPTPPAVASRLPSHLQLPHLEQQQLQVIPGTDYPCTTECNGQTFPPLKPLSAYNYFFRDERDRILAASRNERLPELTLEERRCKLLWDHWSRDRSKKRAHRKSHGKIGFQELSKLISSRWKALSRPEQDYFREVAAIDLERFKLEVKLNKNVDWDGSKGDGKTQSGLLKTTSKKEVETDDVRSSSGKQEQLNTASPS